MMKDINRSPYTKETELKLDIFKRCFREWFPVFLNANRKYTERLYIYDLFAGSGTDADGKWGSPLWLLSEARGEQKQYCTQILNGKAPSIYFAFNELKTEKAKELEEKVQRFFSLCSMRDCAHNRCAFQVKQNIFFRNDSFQNIAKSQNFLSILNNNKFAKFIVLDQYGIKQITPSIFLELTQAPKTDFIFFIASSFLRRFKETEAIKRYFDENKIKFDPSNPQLCHKDIARYYKSLIPNNREYYIHHFTIKKGTNYYGLIFGTGHSLGMEKFLKVCWDEDKLAGESNCNIEQDFEEGTLFYDGVHTNKVKKVQSELKNKINLGEITNNRDGMKFVLSKGCLPKVYIEVIKELLKQNKVQISAGEEFNKHSTNIHKIKIYNFKRV